MKPPRPPHATEEELLAECRVRSIELLKSNLTPAGILAAAMGEKAQSRGYTAVFGRDTAICAIGMALSGDAALVRGAAAGLTTLAEHQASNGQIPKFVDTHRREADFWYLGCIDATLWWLIGLAFLDAHVPGSRLRREHARGIERAIDWLHAQEHQRFRLLQQNEASDWADIMPRSGFVLYTNALWYHVKRLFDLPHADTTRESFNGLFHPFSAGLAEYRRARLLVDYVLRKARDRDLYLSFVNFSFFGEEGDVFGNLLGVLLDLAEPRAARRILDVLQRARVNDPYPVRVVMRPIRRGSFLWRPYMSRHRQNYAWQYHNGGIWPMVGGFWVVALAQHVGRDAARADLVKLAQACRLRNWSFHEWLHGRKATPRGMPGQSWNAAAFLMAEHSLRMGVNPLALPRGPGKESSS